MDFDECMVPQLLAHWNIVPVGEVLSLSDGGPPFEFRSEDGQTFILKSMSGDSSAEQVSRIEALRYLHDAGVPVMCPLTGMDGSLCLVWEGTYWVVYPKIPSSPTPPDVPLAVTSHNIGKALGLLHKALRSYPKRIETWRRKLGESTDDHVASISGYLEGEALRRFAKAAGSTLEGIKARCTGLPHQYIHGDCHSGNYLMDAGNVSGFVDCDHLSWGPRAFDIYYLLVDRLKWHRHKGKPEDWLELLPSYIEGYESVQRLEPREKQAICDGMLAILLGLSSHIISHVPKRVHIVPVSLAAFYWIIENRAAIEQRVQK